MASKLSRSNVGDSSAADKDDRRVIGGRATFAERVLIDTACAKLQQDRATFIIAAALEKAERVLRTKVA